MTGLPAVTSKPSLGIARVSEKALALMRWQPVQWQAAASSGGWLTRIRVWPQRQPPSQGSFHSVILILLRKQPLMGNPMEVGMA
jgi:hypothetical protein